MRTDSHRKFGLALIAAIGFTAVQCTNAVAQDDPYEDLLAAANCGSLQNHYGPFDYTNPSHVAEKLPIVEMYHFNDTVENLRGGMSADIPGPDLDYTLRAFPNHHRALNSMGLYALRHQGERVPPGATLTGDCYFRRAISFRPDDPVVRLVFSVYLAKGGHQSEAIEQLLTALEIDADNPEIHYNLGLLYAKSDRDELALKHARRAYEIGYPLPGLRHILERKGVWKSDP